MVIFETRQTDFQFAQFIAQTTKSCLVVLQASLAPSFAHCNRSVEWGQQLLIADFTGYVCNGLIFQDTFRFNNKCMKFS